MAGPHRETQDSSIDAATTGRRAFLLAGLGTLLAGCATSERLSGRLPSPNWTGHGAADDVVPHAPSAAPHQPAMTVRSFDGVIPRSSWATGAPVPALMNRMRPISYVTIHHDGMGAFHDQASQAAAARIDAIRRSHRGSDWGDIGYHFAIDPAGRVWEGRPIGWQGAHVKDHNEGNVGVVVLGNFELQQPNERQMAALQMHVSRLCGAYRVSASSVRTHQEWAATACPGRNLQHSIERSRRG